MSNSLLHHLTERLRPRHDFTQGVSPSDLAGYVRQARHAGHALGTFCERFDTPFTCVSIGQTCSSAWYLKQVGAKKASYPFDWILTSSDIILDCIADGFRRYLDKANMRPLRRGRSAGHTIYHSSMFSHRSPLASDDDYRYYERCCSRWIDLLNSTTPVVFVCTLINEPEKRRRWASGFNDHFRLPLNQGPDTLRPLFQALSERHPPSRFLVLEQYTDRSPEVTHEIVSDSVMHISFRARGGSNGVVYRDALDDFCAKHIFSALSV